MTQMGTEKRVGGIVERPLGGLVALSAGEKGKQQTVVLMPDGRIELRDGTTLLVDRAGAEDVIAAFRRHGQELPFDRDHAIVLKAPKGEPAFSYGWGKDIRYEEGRGILCDVEWTEEGYEDIRAGRYRYLSPVVGYEAKTGRVRRITCVAMTNVPAQPGMTELAASEGANAMKGLIEKMLQDGAVVATAEQKIGELKALLESKGATLGDGADFVAIVNAAITALKGGGEQKDEAAKDDMAVAASVRVRLSLPADAKKDVVEKALSDVQGHVGYVPSAEHTKVLSRLSALEDAHSERQAKDLVETYLSQGKLLESNEAQMKWAKERAAKDPEG